MEHAHTPIFNYVSEHIFFIEIMLKMGFTNYPVAIRASRTCIFSLVVEQTFSSFQGIE
jgi:hypothetical protein